MVCVPCSSCIVLVSLNSFLSCVSEGEEGEGYVFGCKSFRESEDSDVAVCGFFSASCVLFDDGLKRHGRAQTTSLRGAGGGLDCEGVYCTLTAVSDDEALLPCLLRLLLALRLFCCSVTGMSNPFCRLASLSSYDSISVLEIVLIVSAALVLGFQSTGQRTPWRATIWYAFNKRSTSTTSRPTVRLLSVTFCIVSKN
jgi:hypothetical protein